MNYPELCAAEIAIVACSCQSRNEICAAHQI